MAPVALNTVPAPTHVLDEPVSTMRLNVWVFTLLWPKSDQHRVDPGASKTSYVAAM